MQKVRRHSCPCGHRAPTACKCLVSGAVSLPSPGFFSFFAHATHSLSVVEEYLALEGGPSSFKPGFSCLALLGRTIGSPRPFAYRAITCYGGTFQDLQLGRGFLTSARDCNPGTRFPQHRLQNACRLAGSRFGQIFPVRSPLLRKSSFLSLPEVTEMFQFTSFALPTYGFSRQCRGMNPDPFPDSDICGSKSGWRLTAAYRSRPTSFIASQRQDILQVPLVT